MTPDEYEENHTTSDHLDWLAFLDWEERRKWKHKEPSWFFWANIARVIAQVNAPKGKSYDLEDFLLEFNLEGEVEEKQEREMSPQEIQDIKAQTFMMFGMGLPPPPEPECLPHS